MKKVGIMTWYQHHNYGTTLQAVALLYILKKIGYEAKGIDYISKGYNRETKLEKFFSLKNIKNKAKHVYESKKYILYNDILKKENYEKFIKKYIEMESPTQTSSQLFKLNDKYDAFICGSDQIWTPVAYNSKYFLDFVSDSNKKISYAPSFGVNKIKNNFIKEEIGKQLKTFFSISVREKQGAEMIEKYYGLKAEIVLDPTLLLKKNEWKKMSISYPKKEKILLCYILGENEKIWKEIEKIAQKNNLNIHIIPVHNKDYYRNYTILKGIGPGEFLSEFENADFVCTDSFHGTIFSIINHIPFITFKRFSDKDPKSQNSRIFNLLNTLKLEDHIWRNKYDFVKTNWEGVEDILEDLRNKSLNFLNNSLEKATEKKEIKKHKIITNTCCGCGICAKICPNNAINMIMKNGFYQAMVNDELCINCNLCDEICAYNGETGVNLKSSKLYESKSQNINVLQKSTSGGISHEIITKMSKKGYPILGCIFDKEDGLVKHSLVEKYNEEEIEKFQGSKYLQSYFFDKNLKILDMEKGVIIGTPCQIAAVDNYLRKMKKREQFLLIDLICHGVPTLNLWKCYLQGESIKNVSEVRFRDAKKGWRNIYINSKEKEISRQEINDLFYNFFDLQTCYLPSCYECNFRTSSKADIRLGDYWGKKYTKEELKYGVSMVSTFSDLGEKILKELKIENKILLKEQPIEDYFRGQGPVNPIIPVYYEKLLEDLENKNVNLDHLLKKYCYIQLLNKKIQIYVSKIKRIKNIFI